MKRPVRPPRGLAVVGHSLTHSFDRQVFGAKPVIHQKHVRPVKAHVQPRLTEAQIEKKQGDMFHHGPYNPLLKRTY
jgi:hypothetical protein